jgi:hypothetical protein
VLFPVITLVSVLFRNPTIRIIAAVVLGEFALAPDSASARSTSKGSGMVVAGDGEASGFSRFKKLCGKLRSENNGATHEGNEGNQQTPKLSWL